MSPDDWRQIEALFHHVADLPPHQRTAALDAADPTLRHHVEELLAFDHATAAPLNDAVRHSMQALVDSAPQRFGPYRVTGILGHGGMGAVYSALRDDQAFEKQVAIKVLHHSLDTPAARARFAQERRILASLDHPHIARLIDGGETPAGLSFIVLEYVDGLDILEYATRHQLSREARLRLFLRVCQAVQFAHQNLVVHRDLKPGNILIARDGTPKLLDFGISKLLDPDALQTATALQALTPQYASPEQVRGATITTASDVYSLGLVLYELLTGRRPYMVDTGSPLEIDRIVCQQPAQPADLGSDLDNILAMALRKEPERRYSSVEQFAADIANFLASRPVQARPDTIVYRASKYLRRHRLSLAATAAVLLALTAGAAIALHQARIAQQRFDQVRKLAHRFLFDFHDEAARLDGSTHLREQMVRTAQEYLDNLSRSAAGDLELQKELAAAWQKVGDAQGFPSRPNLGRTRDAIASYRKAAQLHEAIAARDPSHRAALGEFYNLFASLLRQTGDFPSAAQAGQTALRAIDDALRADPSSQSLQRAQARTWCILGDLDEDRNRNNEAYAKFTTCDQLAQALLRRGRTRESLETAQGARVRLGTSATAVGLLDQARAAFDDDEKLLAELTALEPRSPIFRRARTVLAQFRASLYCNDSAPSYDQPAPCLTYSRQYVESARRMVEADPRNTSARTSLAIALFRLSYPLRDLDPPAAVAAARESLELFDRQLAAGNTSFLVTSRRNRALRRLAEALLAARHSAEAHRTALDCLARQRTLAARDPDDLREAALLPLVLLTAAATAEALHQDPMAYLTEAESTAAALYRRTPDELTAVIPLARVRLALARRDPQWRDRARDLWRQFPRQNDYVRRQQQIF